VRGRGPSRGAPAFHHAQRQGDGAESRTSEREQGAAQKGKSNMHHAQTVYEMAEDVLARQAKARAARTGEPSGLRWPPPFRQQLVVSCRGCVTVRIATRERTSGRRLSMTHWLNIITSRYRNCSGSLDRPRNMSLRVDELGHLPRFGDASRQRRTV
jgi:hypothetical protein